MGLGGFLLYPSLESLTLLIPKPEPLPIETRVQPVAQAPTPSKAIAKKRTPAIPIHQVGPSVPEGIRARIEEEISVEVSAYIAPNGTVLGAKTDIQEDGLRSYLAQRAVEAVRQWKFRPARLDRETVPSQTVVRFRFHQSGTEWN